MEVAACLPDSFLWFGEISYIFHLITSHEPSVVIIDYDRNRKIVNHDKSVINHCLIIMHHHKSHDNNHHHINDDESPSTILKHH